MANYTELQKQILDLIDDADTEAEAYFPTAVKLGEDMIFGALPELDCFKREYNTTGQNPDPKQYTQAGDFDGIIELGSTDDTDHEIIRSVSLIDTETDQDGAVIGTKTEPLENRTEEFIDLFGNAAQKPQFFSITNRNPIKIRVSPNLPVANHSYEFLIRSYGNEHLDKDNPDNETWISKNAELALFYAVAINMAIWRSMDEDLPYYKEMFQAELLNLAKQNGMEIETIESFGRKSKKKRAE